MKSAKNQPLICEAPEDVLLVKLELLYGKVTAGQPLATLTSTRLEWLSSRLDYATADLEIQQRPFTEGRIDRILQVLREQVVAATDGVAAADTVAVLADRLVEMGFANPNDMWLVRDDNAQTRAKLPDAKRDLVGSEGKFNDMKGRLGIAHDRLKTESAILQDLRQRLTLTAPGDGVFVASVGQGGFVMEGNPIGFVHPKGYNIREQQLVCAAPDDVKVLEVPTPRGPVTAGQIIARLTSTRLEHLKNRLESHAKDIEIQERPFIDERITKLTKLLNDSMVAAKDSATATEMHYKVLLDKFKLGLKTLNDIVWPRVTSAEAKATLASAILDNEQFPNKVRDLKDRIANSKLQLQRETKIFEELRQMMEVHSPADGQFKAVVGPGSFVQLGDPIGVLHL